MIYCETDRMMELGQDQQQLNNLNSNKMSSPSKMENYNPNKISSPNKRDSATTSQSQVNSKKYSNFVDQSAFSHPPDGIILQTRHQQSSKKTSDLGLIDGEAGEQQQQTTHVEIDLFRGILLMAKSKQLAAICGLIGAFLIHLIVGAIYRWNMITGYVGIYFDTDNETPIGAPLAMLCAGITMRLGFKLSNAHGSGLVMCVAMIMAILATILASKMTSFSTFLFFHNIIYGLCAGLLFLPPLKECHKFFPNLKLITNSIILTGTGLGAVLFGAYNIECIQHQNQTYQMSDLQLTQLVHKHFQGCFLGMSAMVFVVGFAGILLMIPMIIRNQQRDKDQIEKSMTSQRGEGAGNFCKSQLQSFKSRVFWMVGIIIFLTSCGNYYVIMNFKNLLSAEHQRKTFLYWILISGALGNGLTRIIWGFLFSRVGFKWLFCVAASLNIISFLTIMMSNNETLYIIFYTINSISLGGLMVIFPNVSLLIFGKKLGESIYSYYWVAFSLSNFFQFGITLILTQNPTTSDDYGEVLFFFAICVIGGMVLCWREKLQGNWKNSMDLIDFKRSNIRKYSH